MNTDQYQQAIVYIDSDEDDQLLIGSLIRQLAPHRPLHCFTQAEAALDYLRSTDQAPFLILSEILMPTMTGLELRQHIENDERLRQRCIPFIFVANPVMQPVIEKAFALTIQGFFEKNGNLDLQRHVLTLIFQYWETSFHPTKV